MTRLFAERLRLLRQARGLRVRDVAAAIGLSPVVLSRIERGASEPEEETIQRLAGYFGENEEELLLQAGHVPPGLQVILQRHPAESALLLREHFSAGPQERPAITQPTFLPTPLVRGVINWAIRSAADVVLDPICGDGVLLAEVAARMLSLGAKPHDVLNQIHGYDGDPEACARTVRRLHEVAGGMSQLIQREEFLRVAPPSRLPFHPMAPPMVTALVGVVASEGKAATASHRRQARAVAIEAGIQLPEGVAPWAALIIHAASFVQPGGRIALVVPAAILHAHYAASVRSYLAQLFPTLTVITFAKPLAGLAEAVVLLGDSQGTDGVRSIRLDDTTGLESALSSQASSSPKVAEPRPLRWSGASLPTPGLSLVQSLQRAGNLRRLGDLVRIDAGVVTGANPFFVLDLAAAQRLKPAVLRPMLRTAGNSPGLVFRQDDWEATREAGEGCFLLCIPPDAEVDPATRRYLKEGERDGIPHRATCRRRPVWYALSEPKSPSAFLTYLCPRIPRMLVNDAGVVHANALHSVQPRRGVHIAAVVVSFLSSVSLLGCELLGRHYGTGVLKLEPTEVENLLVPYPPSSTSAFIGGLLEDADRLWRDGCQEDAIALVDQTLVCEQLGVEKQVAAELRQCYASERERRRTK